MLMLTVFCIGGGRMSMDKGNTSARQSEKPSNQLREAIVERMNSLFAENGAVDEGSVVVAMSMGEKRLIERDLRADYATSGAAHVLALSGLHIGIVFFFFKLLVPRRRPSALSRWHLFGESLLIAAIWCYVLLVGMPPSAVRAATMVSLYEVMSLQCRDRVSLNVIGTTAFVMLMFCPTDIYNIGFEFSFAAVISIILNFKTFYSIVSEPSNRIVKALWSMVCVSVAAQIGVAPLIAYHFGYVAVYSVFSSMVVVPCAWVIVNLSVLLILFLKFAAVARLIVVPLTLTADFMNDCVTWFAALPGATIDNVELNGAQLLTLYLAIGSACLLVYRYVKTQDCERLKK